MAVIILHRTGETFFNRLYAIVLSIVIDSPYGHLSIITDRGDRYDASAFRGSFGKAKPLSPTSSCLLLAIELPDVALVDLDLLKFMGRKYDWGGIIGYLGGWHNPQKLFCFEAGAEVLRSRGVKLRDGRIKTGKGILADLLALGYTASIQKEKYFAKKYNRV